MVYVVLPEMDIVRGILLLNGVAVIPSLVFPVCASDVKLSREASANEEVEKRGPVKTFIVFCANILTAVIQFSFIPLVLVTDNFLPTSILDKDLVHIVLFILAMMFVSFSWWENFVDDRFCGTTSGRSFMKTTVLAMKFDLQEARPVVTFFTSFVKIAVTVLATWATKAYKPFSDMDNAQHHSIENVTLGQVFEKLGDMPIKDNGAIITLTLTSFVGYYVSYTACKLKLQRFSFNIPLILSTPVAVILAALDCDGDLFGTFTNELQNDCKAQDLEDSVFMYVVGAILWLSLYWLCRYIFYPNIERLAKTER